LLSLEHYNDETKVATKAAIFRERTIQHRQPVASAASPKKALLVTLNERGCVDLAATEIDVRLGASWLPREDVERFVHDLLGVGAGVEIGHVPALGTWYVKGDWDVKRQTANTTDWGTDRCSALDLIEDALKPRNHMLGQFSTELLTLYPGANILVAGKEDFEAANRRKLFSRIATGNWDAVIVTHSGFEHIPPSQETQRRFFEEQLHELEMVKRQHTMQRYLQPDELRKHSLHHFDSWAATFGEPVTAMELSPDGAGYRLNTRFARFINVPELMQMFHQAADVQMAQMLNLPRPTLENDKPAIRNAPPTPELKAFVQELAARADRLKTARVDPRVDNMLKITSEGRKAALDLRLVEPTAGDDPSGKVNLAVENILRIWQETTERRSTQKMGRARTCRSG